MTPLKYIHLRLRQTVTALRHAAAIAGTVTVTQASESS